MNWSVWILLTLLGQTDSVAVKCVFHGKRKLVCDVDGNDVTSNYSCRVCPHSRMSQSEPITCPSSSLTSHCPVSTDRCVYDCDKYGYCSRGHLIMLTSDSERARNGSFCAIVDTSKHVKPGPVEGMSLTLLDPGTVKVKWGKPADRWNEGDTYTYQVRCQHQGPHKTMRSRKKDPHVLCTYSHPRLHYTVSIRARPRHGGYWGVSTTTTVHRLSGSVWNTPGGNTVKGEGRDDSLPPRYLASLRTDFLVIIGAMVILGSIAICGFLRRGPKYVLITNKDTAIESPCRCSTKPSKETHCYMLQPPVTCQTPL